MKHGLVVRPLKKGIQMEDEPKDNSIVNSRVYVKNSYADLLLYYQHKGLGKISEIAGATITEDLIDTIERRFIQLGGNPALLYLRASMPSLNGQLKKKESKR